MDRIELVKTVGDIPEDFDITTLNNLDGGERITIQVEDWIYISLLCDRADIYRSHEHPEIAEDFQEKVRDVTLAAYNRYANRNNYAKEMVEKGLWPDHSKNGGK